VLISGRKIFAPVPLVVGVIAIGALIVFQSDSVASIWSALLVDVQNTQRDLHRQLASAMRAVRAEEAAAGWTLVTLSFLYGVFHAAGPGHGKLVISTYILTQESQLRRGLLLSLIASLCQGATAVIAVSATVGFLGLSMRQAQGAATNLETLSYGLLALVGLILMVSRWRNLSKRRKNVMDNTDIKGHHSHKHGPHCSHAHGPSLEDLEKPVSWQSISAMIASIGLRPCSGAILVLLVAYAFDLHWVGVGAVLAMSIGTAITVSLLAVISVYLRKASLRMATHMPDYSIRIATVIDVAGLIGGGIILLTGLLLFHASMTIPAHPLAM
jgi:nickel/cobalt exporter